MSAMKLNATIFLACASNLKYRQAKGETKTMKSMRILALTASLVMAAPVTAQVEQEHEMKIVVAGTMGDEPTTIHWIGSGDSGFNMHDMQVGETQSIVDESGRTVLITRQGEGFKFEVDGKTIMIPEMTQRGQYVTLADGPNMSADFDVEVIADDFTTHDSNTVTIISSEPLDTTTQESIKAVLQSAGRDDTVTFIDGGSTQAQQVKVVRKRVEIQQ